MVQSSAAGAVPAFEIDAPARQLTPIVLNAPHSGRVYAEDFVRRSRLDQRAIRTSEDVLVDELFRPAAAIGAPLMRANFPRAWLDVNREPYELDPAMFAAPLPAFVNHRSARVAGGLGTIPRIVAENEEIYDAPLQVAEALDRIETVYKPYHRALRKLVDDTHAEFDVAVLIDGHSMPSTVRGHHSRYRPDVILGDRYGTSCDDDLTDFCAGTLTRLGYRVARNKPYAGGFITEHYGRPRNGVHALQIEMNRGLYMDEATLEPNAGFDRVQRDLAVLVAELAAALADGLLYHAQAAE